MTVAPSHGTLGSSNHYVEVQKVAKIVDRAAATAFLAKGDLVVSIHYGSHGLVHQNGTAFLRKTDEMLFAAARVSPIGCPRVRSSQGRVFPVAAHMLEVAMAVSVELAAVP